MRLDMNLGVSEETPITMGIGRGVNGNFENENGCIAWIW